MLSFDISPLGEFRPGFNGWWYSTSFFSLLHMMTSSNGNIFRVTVPLCAEFTGHRWIPLTKASDAELWCFLWSSPEQTAVQTIETPVIWDAIALIITSLLCVGWRTMSTPDMLQCNSTAHRESMLPVLFTCPQAFGHPWLRTCLPGNIYI